MIGRLVARSNKFQYAGVQWELAYSALKSLLLDKGDNCVLYQVLVVY